MYPPSPSVLRARFPELLRSEPALVPAAYALDSVLLEITFVCAPLIVVAVIAVLGAGAALVVSAATVLLGVGAFVWLLPPDRPPAVRHDDAGLLGVLRAPGIRTLVMTMVPVGFAIGALEVAVPAFSHDQSRAELAGVLLATWSMGSAIGGFVYGARVRRSPLPLVHQRLTLLLPLGFLPLLVAPTMAVMALLLRARGTVHRADHRHPQRARQPGRAGRHQDRGPHVAADGAGGRHRARSGGRWRADRCFRLACGRARGGAERVRRGARGDLAPLLAAGRGRRRLTRA